MYHRTNTCRSVTFIKILNCTVLCQINFRHGAPLKFRGQSRRDLHIYWHAGWNEKLQIYNNLSPLCKWRILHSREFWATLNIAYVCWNIMIVAPWFLCFHSMTICKQVATFVWMKLIVEYNNKIGIFSLSKVSGWMLIENMNLWFRKFNLHLGAWMWYRISIILYNFHAH